MNKQKFLAFLLSLCIIVSLFSGCVAKNIVQQPTVTEVEYAKEEVPITSDEIETDGSWVEDEPSVANQSFSLSNIPAFSDKSFVFINENEPFFLESELSTKSSEFYSDLDRLGRCGPTFAIVGNDIMPKEERGEIGKVKPTGWHTVKYDFVDGKYLYNRCHLIGYQLTGENANVKNLITGTRYMNVEGMLQFENEVANYVKSTGNHVAYRVTPIFDGDNLLASGVLIEALSIEDNGSGVKFCVYCYNAQPGVIIDYKTGDSKDANATEEDQTIAVVLNTGSKKFHKPDCDAVSNMKEASKDYYKGSRQKLINQGYSPCGSCNP